MCLGGLDCWLIGWLGDDCVKCWLFLGAVCPGWWLGEQEEEMGTKAGVEQELRTLDDS